jgi:LDH2 family malate/lactate/ureidoglycolate dehydrogenase
LVIDIGQLMDLGRFTGELDELLGYVASAEPAVGGDGVLIPGQREYAALRRSEKDGIVVEEGVWRQLSALAEELGVEL